MDNHKWLLRFIQTNGPAVLLLYWKGYRLLWFGKPLMCTYVHMCAHTYVCTRTRMRVYMRTHTRTRA